MLRWGLLGASRIGKTLAPAMRGAGDTVQAVAARDLGRAQAYARDLGIGRAYGGYDALLADPEVDAVYVALPNDQHLPLTLAALAAGKHVLCEKPLALNAGEVTQMRAAGERSGKVVLEAFAYRFHPQIGHALELAREGALGEVRSARASFGFTLERPDDFRWRPEKGGGALYDLGCYCVNSLRLLLGQEPARAAAFAREEGGVDTDFGGLLDFGEGLPGSLDCSFAAQYHQSLSLVGSRGILTLERPYSSKGQAATLRLNDEVQAFAPLDAYKLMVEHFGKVVRGEEALRYPLADAEAQARVLDALFASAREGRMIEV